MLGKFQIRSDGKGDNLQNNMFMPELTIKFKFAARVV